MRARHALRKRYGRAEAGRRSTPIKPETRAMPWGDVLPGDRVLVDGAVHDVVNAYPFTGGTFGTATIKTTLKPHGGAAKRWTFSAIDYADVLY